MVSISHATEIEYSTKWLRVGSLELEPEPGTEKKRGDSKFQIITRALSFKLNPIPAPLDAVVLAATETLLSTLLGVAVDFRGCASTRLGCQEARWAVVFQHRLIRSVLYMAATPSAGGSGRPRAGWPCRWRRAQRGAFTSIGRTATEEEVE
jgi:hypothetical protein